MEKVMKLVQEAKKALNTADHLAYVTYPLVKDIKLLLSAAENIYVSMVAGMEALLAYDRLYKRIGPLPENFDSRLEIFKTKVARRYSIDRMYISTLMDLRDVILLHKKSPMEFTRKDKFIIFAHNYKIMKTINIEKIKDFLTYAKPFIGKVSTILSRHDRGF